MKDKKTDAVLGGALVAFARITGWIATPIVAAVLLGGRLDEKYGSGNKILFLSAGIAMIISIVGVAIETKRYMRQVEKQEEQKKNDNGISNN